MAHLNRQSSVPKAPADGVTGALVPHEVRYLEALAERTTITVEEAASLLGIGRSAAYEAARRGQLPARRLGRRLFVPVPAFLEWLGATSLPERDQRLQV